MKKFRIHKSKRPGKSKSGKSSLLKNDVKGIGQYSKGKLTKGGISNSAKTVAGLTRKQAYNLEKEALKAQKMHISSKPEIIKAAGQAIAMNTTGAQGGIVLGVADKFKKNSTSNSINSLINSGSSIATKDNAEEEKEKFSDFIIG